MTECSPQRHPCMAGCWLPMCRDALQQPLIVSTTRRVRACAHALALISCHHTSLTRHCAAANCTRATLCRLRQRAVPCAVPAGAPPPLRTLSMSGRPTVHATCSGVRPWKSAVERSPPASAASCSARSSPCIVRRYVPSHMCGQHKTLFKQTQKRPVLKKGRPVFLICMPSVHPPPGVAAMRWVGNVVVYATQRPPCARLGPAFMTAACSG